MTQPLKQYQMETVIKVLCPVLRYIAIAIAAVLFITGMALTLVEPGWSSAQYLVGGIYILIEAFLLGLFRRSRIH